jgi:hypothetical protein
MHGKVYCTSAFSENQLIAWRHYTGKKAKEFLLKPDLWAQLSNKI